MSSTTEVTCELDPPLDDELTGKLVTIWTAVSNAGGAVGFVPPVTEDDVRTVADSAFSNAATGQGHLVVGFGGDEPVGFLFLEPRPGPLFRHWMTIKRLQVDPARQKEGIGKKILECTHEIARDMGLEQLHLTVRGGTGTERFYESHGYEVMARIPDVIRLSPTDTREEIYMVKRLHP
ncbi:MAG: GNAT family N-acetyltransferase [Actinomycetota bacterium]